MVSLTMDDLNVLFPPNSGRSALIRAFDSCWKCQTALKRIYWWSEAIDWKSAASCECDVITEIICGPVYDPSIRGNPLPENPTLSPEEVMNICSTCAGIQPFFQQVYSILLVREQNKERPLSWQLGGISPTSIMAAFICKRSGQLSSAITDNWNLW